MAKAQIILGELGGGSSNYTKESGSLTVNVAKQFKTKNCTFLSATNSDTADMWTTPASNSVWAAVVNGEFAKIPDNYWHTITYDPSTEILSITVSSSTQLRYLIIGEFEEVT